MAVQHASLLLRGCVVYLSQWPGERDLVEQICRLLGALVNDSFTKSPDGMTIAAKLEQFDELLAAHGRFGEGEWCAGVGGRGKHQLTSFVYWGFVYCVF